MKKSSIIVRKSKFFLFRTLTYFSFLLVPIYLQKAGGPSPFSSLPLMIFYGLFMAGQWFFLGKEIDHRLKIFYRVNSSLDRVVYRLFLGQVFFILFFNIIHLLPHKWTNNLFWATWAVLGLFYSWPTRGKIIEESMSGQFGEFRFLDSFERACLFLISLFIIISFPDIPQLIGHNALRLYYDPLERISPLFWNYLEVFFIPFKSYPGLWRFGLSSYFYFMALIPFLLSFYAVGRYFLSRRMALLSILIGLSSWSLSKILGAHPGHLLMNTSSLIGLWGVLWFTQSESYRSGLLLGLLFFWCGLFHSSFIIFSLALFPYLFLGPLRGKTTWFKNQVLRYAAFGLGLGLMNYFIGNAGDFGPYELTGLMGDWGRLLERKGLFILVFLAPWPWIVSLFSKQRGSYRMTMDISKVRPWFICWAFLCLYGLLFNRMVISDFFTLWAMALICVVPLESVFRAYNRLRSRRNFLFGIYLILTLADSHVEGRLKILIQTVVNESYSIRMNVDK